MSRFFVAFFFLLVVVESSQARCKNLYVLIEPNSSSQSESYKDILEPSFRNLENIMKWIQKDKTSPKFNNIFIRVVGYETKLYKKKSIGRINGKLFKSIYKEIKNKKNYSIADGLGYFSQDMRANRWKGEETILLIIGDINYRTETISSHGMYFNSSWITNKNSVFYRNFLSKDNDIAKDTSVVIFTRTHLDMKNEKRREDFLVNLFEESNMKVYYVGGFHNNFIANLKDRDTFSIKLIDKVRIKDMKPMEKSKLDETKVCQIVGKKTMTIKNCGRGGI